MDTDPSGREPVDRHASPRPAIDGVLETVVYAEDLGAARTFYEDVLGLPVVAGDGVLAFAFRVAPGSVLIVFDPRESSPDGRAVPSHGATGPGHLAIRIRPDQYTPWIAHLQGNGTEIEHVQEWPIEPHGASDGPPPRTGRSIYLRDPAGNSVELITADIWPSVGSGADPA